MQQTVRGRAVIFDMDGTLVDSSAMIEAVWTAFADRHGLSASDVLASCPGRQIIDTVREFAPAGTDHDTLAAEVAVMAAESPLVGVEVVGAAPFLRSIPLAATGLVTSAPRALATTRMTAAGLLLPPALVAAEDVLNGKPHPEGYLRAASTLGIRPDAAIVFEDAAAGISSARAAGMQVVVVGSYEGPEADGLHRIADFAAAWAGVDDTEVVIGLETS